MVQGMRGESSWNPFFFFLLRFWPLKEIREERKMRGKERMS